MLHRRLQGVAASGMAALVLAGMQPGVRGSLRSPLPLPAVTRTSGHQAPRRSGEFTASQQSLMAQAVASMILFEHRQVQRPPLHTRYFGRWPRSVPQWSAVVF